jgi:Tol biopolymer transport system component
LKDESHLFVRDNRTGDIRPLHGTGNAVMPFFSPDGESVGFIGAGKLKRVPVRGGEPTVISDQPPTPFGAAWAADGTVVFAHSPAGPLMRVPAEGGKPTPFTTLGKGELSHRWPSILPDGKTVLYAAGTGAVWADARIVAQRLDGGPPTVLVEGGTSPRYAPSGHLVYARGSAIHAVPLDIEELKTTGPSRLVVDGVQSNGTDGRAHFSFSSNGTLVFLANVATSANRALAWVDRDGSVQPLPTPQRGFEHPRISPDGRYIALTIRGEGDPDIWLYDIARAALSRFTFEPGEDESPVWTPDSRYVTFSSSRIGKPRQTLWRPVDGSRPEEEIFSSDRHQHLGGWTPDGQTLVSEEVGESWSIYTARRGEQGKAWNVTPFQEQGVVPSPDGRWLAYSSNESGPSQVYVQSFPGPGGKVQVSVDGGGEPRWSPKTRELFYRNGDKMMVVAYETTPQFTPAPPKVLFTLKTSRMGWAQANYDVSPDGKRFLVITGDDELLPTSLNVLTNWFADLRTVGPTR